MSLEALTAAVEQAGAAGPSWLTLVLAVLAAVGGVGGIVALLNLPKMRKKIDADTADVLTGAAVALVEPLKEQVEALTARMHAMEAERLAQQRQHHVHKQWDELAYALAHEGGYDLPKPPPLRPAAA